MTDLFSAREWFALGAMLAVFLAVNVATAGLSPAVWMDEVMYADPGVNLALDGRFVSSAWYAQDADALWAGNTPLYPLLLAGWVRIFGFGLTEVRALNAFLIVLCGLTAAALWRRTDAAVPPVYLFAGVAAMLSATSVAFCFRGGRPDTLGLLLLLFLALSTTIKKSRTRLFVLACVAALVPLAGLQFAFYAGLLCALWLCVMRRNWLEAFATGVGIAIGLSGLLAFYANRGVLPGFFASIMPHFGAQSAEHPFAGLIEAFTADRSLLLYLAAFWILAFFADGLPRRALFLGLTALTAPVILSFAGKFTLYYSWMSALPALYGALLLMRGSHQDGGSPRRGIAFLCGASFIALASLIGWPARLAVAAVEREGRDYARIEQFVDSAVRADDVVFADFQAYYALRARRVRSFYPQYIAAISEQERAALTLLLVKTEVREEVQRQIGGQWAVAARLPPSGDSLLRRMGIVLAPPYDLVALRRVTP